MGTEVLVGLLMSAAATGLQYENTRRTANKQDGQAAQGIRNQAAKQRVADARVDEEVQKLKGSTAEDERRERLADYMTTIQRSKGGMTAGLTPQVGSQAFKGDSAEAAAGVEAATADRAGLLSRVDAAGMQRQGEGFGFGNLATDINRISREAKGDAFIDELRLRAIRRNPWMDMAASGLQAAGSAYASQGGAGGYEGIAGQRPYMAPAPSGPSWLNAYGASMAGRGPNYGG